ncbi:MAG: glycosyltransferase [Candidatus Faecousia sp.]|nr:glycosyltransferase [Candidatus Faecousia sp.]
MNQTISVIVPVFNVAGYLPQCVDSILSQDYGNLEVILIDDGSTDGSGEICDRYAALDSRVRAIHQKNGGAAAAKNAGLRLATGEYLAFADSDDYLEPGAYGFLMKILLENGADAVQGSFREVYRNRAEEQRISEEILEGYDYLLRFPKDFSCALLWNKLYRRALFDGVFFEEGHKIDDEYFTYQGFLQPRKVVRADRIVYNYRKRASSVMSSPESAERLVLDCLDSAAKRRQRILDTLPQLREPFDENYLDVIWYLSGNEGSTERTLQALKGSLHSYLREKGRTRPPVYLWRGLAKLWLIPVPRLLMLCKRTCKQIDLSDYFD